jgi:hypothetical protein
MFYEKNFMVRGIVMGNSRFTAVFLTAIVLFISPLGNAATIDVQRNAHGISLVTIDGLLYQPSQ